MDIYFDYIHGPFREYIKNLFSVVSRNEHMNFDIFKLIFNAVVIPDSGMDPAEVSFFLNQLDNGKNGGFD